MPSDDLLLAALDRAERHQSRVGQGVLLRTLKEHLGLPRHSGITLRLRPQLGRLQADELIEQTSHGRLIVWKLTVPGHARLRDARAAPASWCCPHRHSTSNGRPPK